MIRDPRVAFEQLFGVGATPEERAGAPADATAASSTGSSARCGELKRELGAERSRAARRVPRRRARDRAAHPDGRGAQHERRAARAARARRSACPTRSPSTSADVRPPGAGVRGRHHARRSRSRWAATGRTASIPESGSTRGLPPRVAPRRNAKSAIIDFAEDQQVSREHAAVFPREAEEDARRRQQPARQDAHRSTARRWATRTCTTTGAARCSSPRAARAAASRATCTSRRPDGTPMANVMLSLLHSLGMDDIESFGDSTGALDSPAALKRTERTVLTGRSRCRVARGRRCVRCRRVLSAALPPRCRRAGRRRGDAPGRRRRCARCSRQGADVNAAQGDGMTALHWAAMQRRRGAGPDAPLRRRERPRNDADRRLHRRCTSPRARPARRW